MILKDIINIIESVAPLNYQEDWDNSGMQVGDTGADIDAALLTTDVTEAVVGEAIAKNCQLILSHHPLLYQGLKHICGRTPQERCVQMAIEHHIAIYSAHTTMDSYLHGVSGIMAQRLGIHDYRILVPASGATQEQPHGLGVIGMLPEAMCYQQFLQLVKQQFNAPWVRYIDAPKQLVQCIAMCGGAGGEFMEDAIQQGADVFLTADCKYHMMQAAEGRIGLVDIDHWTSEQYIRCLFEQLLTPHIQVHLSEEDQGIVKSLD